MAYYRPDYDAINGKKHLEEMKGEKGRLIKYYVKTQDEQIKKLNKRIDEMQEVFNGIKRFTK